MNLINIISDISTILLITFSVWDVSECYPRFQQHIPNGNIVPNPCARQQTWAAIGHWNPSRGTAINRNPFGEDFMLSNFTYTTELHHKDSDGDGVSNGDELNAILVGDSFYLMGDPHSHPGICEPLDSPRCTPQQFSCSQFGAPRVGVNNHQTGNIHLPNTNNRQNNNPFGSNIPSNNNQFTNNG